MATDPLITTLILDQDNSEVIRDRIAEILLVESARQQELALEHDPPQDPDQWVLRVFTERTNAWDEFLPVDADGDDAAPQFAAPIVNVSVYSVAYDGKASNPISRQKGVGIFHIDCFGYGVSRDLSGDGHDPGDARASLEAQRAARLVRKILMAGAYAWLGLPRGASQFVWSRRVESIQTFDAQLGERPAAHVAAVRVAFQVEFNETAPQVESATLEEIVVSITRAETGEVTLTYQVGESSP